MRRVNPELRVNCFLAPTHAVKEDGQAAITDFEVSGMTRLNITRFSGVYEKRKFAWQKRFC